MSHNRHETVNTRTGFEVQFYRTLISLLGICVLLFGMTANAATISTKLKRYPTYTLKADLDQFSSTENGKISGLNPEYTVRFNLPAHEWYESLELFVSVFPKGNVDKRQAIFISYNNAKPVPLKPHGRGFDAHIRLDPSLIRANGNTLKFSMKETSFSNCVAPEGGEWVINLKKSKLVSQARAKNRAMTISDFQTRIQHPMTAPKTVHIKANSPHHKTAFEALSAQAISLRTPSLPSFNTNAGPADLELIYARFDALGSYKKNLPKFAPTSGPIIMVDKSRNNRLVLAAANDDGLLKLARAFAKYELPNIQRTTLSIIELHTSPKLHPIKSLAVGENIDKYLSAIIFDPSWVPAPQSLMFNSLQSANASGELVLDLRVSQAVSDQSKLRVLLNNHSIGYTLLDKAKKRVSFDIPSGTLKAYHNELTFIPVLQAKPTNGTCLQAPIAPLLDIEDRSTLSIQNSQPLSMADLNRFAASGQPFHADTTVVMTATNTRDKTASLKVLSHAARAFGPVLANANYINTPIPQSTKTGNLLIIGPRAFSNPVLREGMPTAVKSALNGKTLTAINIEGPRKPDQHAGSDAKIAFEIAARKMNTPTRIGAGGIAALYPSPYANGHFIGVITTNQQNRFSMLSLPLMSDQYWNRLSGSVVRWNNKDILTAQVAYKTPLMDTQKPRRAKSSLRVYERFDSEMQSMSDSISGFFASKFKSKKSTTPKAVKSSQLTNISTSMSSPQLRGQSNGRNTRFTPSTQVAGTSPAFLGTLKTKWDSSVRNTERFFDKTLSAWTLKANRWKSKTSLNDWIPNWFKSIDSHYAIILLLICLATILMLIFSSPKQHKSR